MMHMDSWGHNELMINYIQFSISLIGTHMKIKLFNDACKSMRIPDNFKVIQTFIMHRFILSCTWFFKQKLFESFIAIPNGFCF